MSRFKLKASKCTTPRWPHLLFNIISREWWWMRKCLSLWFTGIIFSFWTVSPIFFFICLSRQNSTVHRWDFQLLLFFLKKSKLDNLFLSRSITVFTFHDICTTPAVFLVVALGRSTRFLSKATKKLQGSALGKIHKKNSQIQFSASSPKQFTTSSYPISARQYQEMIF